METEKAVLGGFTVGRPASREKAAWEIGEVALVFLVQKSEGAKKRLAELLSRSEGAIDFAWRWCDSAKFPKEAENRIDESLPWVRHVLGVENRGTLAL